jgi:hypothetical protein
MRPPYKEDHSAAWHFITPTPTPRLTLTPLAPAKRPIQSKRLQSRREKLPGTTSSASSRLWCPHIARSLAQALPVARSKYAQSKNPFRPLCPAIAYVLCLDVHERLLTILSSTLPATEITTTPHLLPTKQPQQYRSTHKLRLINTMLNTSVTHHSHTISSRTTMFSQFKLLPLTISNHKRFQCTRTITGRPTPTTSTSP